MSKPLSAVDLLDRIKRTLRDLKEDRIYALYERLLGHDEIEYTMLELSKLANEAFTFDCLLDQINDQYKHVELQSWEHDNEVV